ncbi:MAG: hypothetical protein K9M55_11620 [Candidatus Marinimicrobia bacterium]|nr:hypothetical protein [Candidatus Neomarinimicrobiota bacterium]MCF7923338.1 hypothetical protein [Candidatus Neomarinimicrobiota bacterium]
MIKKFKLAGLMILLLTLNVCSSNSYLSQAATADFRNDGDRIEWAGRFQIPDDESFAMAISNDKNYLYVALSSIQRDFQRQLAKNGLTLWIDVKGGKRQNLGIKFDGRIPSGRRRDVYQRGQNQIDGSRQSDSRFDDMKMFEGDLVLIVIDTKAGKSLGPADLLATGSSEDGSLFIEYQIPLALLGDKFDPSKKLGLGFESTFERPALEDRPAGMSSGMGGGRGGMDGEMMDGGHRPGGRPGTGMGQNSLDVWMKVQLAP